MQSLRQFLHQHKQNHKLPIRIVSPGFGHISPENLHSYGPIYRTPHYFFLFMIDGNTCHGVDLEQFHICNNELLFILPHQIHQLPPAAEGNDYFKLGFEEECLSLLPRQYPFLINPFNIQKIEFSPAAASRLKSIFAMLLQLLSDMHTDPELILAHLNALLTEINTAYFSTDKHLADDHLSKYIRFKLLVEEHLTAHPTIIAIAEKLAINTNSLYTLVKHYSGLSPKEFITSRLMLEAKRRLYYSKSSIKELAYDLGFNDPEYFSRLFRKTTGKTIARFVQDLSGN